MQLPHNWGPLPPPGWGGLPANGSVNYTWTPSADGGGHFWDGKSGNAKASNINPAQAIASAKDDVSDAVAVRHCAGAPMCTHLCTMQCVTSELIYRQLLELVFAVEGTRTTACTLSVVARPSSRDALSEVATCTGALWLSTRLVTPAVRLAMRGAVRAAQACRHLHGTRRSWWAPLAAGFLQARAPELRAL